jgi:peptidoglycan/LPS O-acetylase OafA/YrhL
MEGRRWARLDGVDCLRALAIVYVLLNHVNMRLFLAQIPYTQGLPRQLVTALVWQGQAGVQIFFAVSGFLITATAMRRWGKLADVSIREFYGMRLARIAPLLLTLLVVLSALHLAQAPDFIVSKDVGGLRGALAAALTLRVGLLEATKGYLPGSWDILWSLSVEELFYLCFPVACRWLGRGQGLVGLLLVLVVLGPFARTVLTHGNEVWYEYSYLGGMDAIAMGCLTAMVVARRRLSRGLLRGLCGVGLALMVFRLCFWREVARLGLERLGLGMTLLAVGTCMVIAAAAGTQWRAPRWLRPLLAYGRRSYEIYLTHMFVVFAGFGLFLKLGGAVRMAPVLFVGVIVVAGVLGEVVGRFYSEPANLWLRARFGSRAEESQPSVMSVS